jgi:hypothetical protein
MAGIVFSSTLLVEDKEGHWVKIKEPVAKEHP